VRQTRFGIIDPVATLDRQIFFSAMGFASFAGGVAAIAGVANAAARTVTDK
jgi:hypothetical protein